jgi:hypothetical protein
LTVTTKPNYTLKLDLGGHFKTFTISASNFEKLKYYQSQTEEISPLRSLSLSYSLPEQIAWDFKLEPKEFFWDNPQPGNKVPELPPTGELESQSPLVNDLYEIHPLPGNHNPLYGVSPLPGKKMNKFPEIPDNPPNSSPEKNSERIF